MKFSLYHPKVTLAVVRTAVASAGASLVATAAAFAPLTKVEILKPIASYVTSIDGYLIAGGAVCTALCGVLAAIAGAGRSYIPTVDQGVKPNDTASPQ